MSLVGNVDVLVDERVIISLMKHSPILLEMKPSRRRRLMSFYAYGEPKKSLGDCDLAAEGKISTSSERKNIN